MVAVGCAGVVGVWKLWECRSCRSEDSDVACDFAGKLKTRSAVVETSDLVNRRGSDSVEYIDH